MNLPDRVNIDLRQRERDNDDAEEYFAMNRDSMIEEEVYRLEKGFSVDDLQLAISTAHWTDLLMLWEAMNKSEDCGPVLRDIRDAWIKRKAEEKVENDE